VHALLEQLKRRPPRWVQRDELAIQQHRLVDQLGEPAQFRVGAGDLPLGARMGPHQPAREHRGDGAHAVPLELEGPALIPGRHRPGQGEHRRDRRR
jgi:hypothetical protein